MKNKKPEIKKAKGRPPRQKAAPEISAPEVETAPVKEQPAPAQEEKLEFTAPEKAKEAAHTCGKCKAELANKPKFCPSCGIELDWRGFE